MPAPEAVSIDNNPRPDVSETTTINEVMANSTQTNIAETAEGYSYTRADGTVEHALSPEDAIRRCPVLGKMTLEQANVLLEIAALGEEKLKQSTPTNNAETETQIEKSHFKPKSKEEVVVHSEKPINKEHTELDSATIEQIRPTPKDTHLESLPESIQAVTAKTTPGNVTSKAIIEKRPIQLAAEEHFRQVSDTNNHQLSISNAPAIEAQTNQTPVAIIEPIIRPATTQETVATPDISVNEPMNEIDKTALESTQPEQTYLRATKASTESDALETFLPTENQELWDSHSVDEISNSEPQTNTKMPTGQPQPELINELEKADFTKIEAEVDTADTIKPIEREQELVLDNFTQTLETILESSVVAPEGKVNEATDITKDSVNEYTKEQVESITPIVQLITNKIGAIGVSVRKDIAPVVAEITTLAISLQSIDQYETENTPELETRLELLCIKLFELLEIEQDDSNIRLFIQFITEEFIAFQVDNSSVDLEHDGTREAKVKLPALSHFVADEKRQLKQILGRFTLTYSQLLSAKPLYLA